MTFTGFRKRAITHPSRANLVAYLAEHCGVSVERFHAVVAARKAFRRGKMYRRKDRRRTMQRPVPDDKRHAKRKNFSHNVLLFGEGEFIALLKQMNMTIHQFAKMVGVSESTVRGWDGHPMSYWQADLLAHMLFAEKATELLKKHGYDVESLWPKRTLPKSPMGAHPRNIKAVVEKAKKAKEQQEPVEYSPWKKP